MIRSYFFGVSDPSTKGHFLYEMRDGFLRSADERRSGIPFRVTLLDGGLLCEPQEQGRLHLAIINGWTILGMWDRTADTRGNSNASFIMEGVHTLEEMKEHSRRIFPALWERIQGRG